MVLLYAGLGALTHPWLAAALWIVWEVTLVIRARGDPVTWAGERVNRRILKQQWMRNPVSRPGAVQLRCDENGLCYDDDFQSVIFPWSAVEAIKETANLFLVRVGNATTLLVPKRDFKNSSDSDNFVKYIRNRIEGCT